MRKVMDHADEIIEVDAHLLDDAEVGLVAYGISARTSIAAVKRLRAKGVKAGLLRLKTLWPFPEREIAKLGERVRAIVVPELNKGMIASVVRGCTKAQVHSITQTNGKTIDPSLVVRFVEEMS
jgi:2-oxoglutarate ferredoxin oxidoreductase subunit alpha